MFFFFMIIIIFMKVHNVEGNTGLDTDVGEGGDKVFFLKKGVHTHTHTQE